jgi:hypothetical protein
VSLPLFQSIGADESTIIRSVPKAPFMVPRWEAPKYGHALKSAKIEREPSNYPTVSGSSTKALIDPNHSGYPLHVLSIPSQDVKSFSKGYSEKLHTSIGRVEDIKKHIRPCICSDPSCKDLDSGYKPSLQQYEEDEMGTSDLFSPSNSCKRHCSGLPVQKDLDGHIECAEHEYLGPAVNIIKKRTGTIMLTAAFTFRQEGDLRRIKWRSEGTKMPRYLGVQHRLIIHGDAQFQRLFILSPSAEAVINYLLRSFDVRSPTLNLTVKYSSHAATAKQLEEAILEENADMQSDLEEVQLAEGVSSNTQSESDFSNSGDDTDWEVNEEFLPIDERLQFTTPNDLIMWMVRGFGQIILEPILKESKKGLVDRLMEEFWQLGFKEFSANLRHRGSSQTSGPSVVSNISNQRAEDSNPKSRRRATEDDWGDNGKDDDGQRRKRPRLETSKASSMKDVSLFACPYRKHNPRKYNVKDSPRCALTGHSTTARVKLVNLNFRCPHL